MENAALVTEIKDIFQESHETYGSPRIHAELCERGFVCSRPRVARLMRAHDIQAKAYRKFVKTTQRAKKSPPQTQDLIRRNFQVGGPNRVWVADLTYIKVNHHWVYLAIVLDLFSRKVVGMALKNHMKSDLILSALNQALTHRKPPQGLIHHSDLGAQYTSEDLNKVARQNKIKLSYGQCAYDNAAMESFFHTLKTEWVYFKNYKSIEEANTDIFNYIFTFYNTKRRHSTLNYHSPETREKLFDQNQKFISVRSVQ